GRGGELNSIIGKGTWIQGDMKVQNSIRVDGRVVGNVQATDTVVVGKEGEVEGNVQAKHVFLAGKVRGNIHVPGKIALETKSVVIGDIKASRLVIDEGALFNGKCIMKESEKYEGEDHH
ncbi:MAG TPA: polymer-forming cytoskeletal protein, partial [bacterium]